MKRWYSGQELIERWHVQNFDLVEFIKQGLQPYTQHGKKVLDIDELPKARHFSIEEMEKHVQAQDNAGRVLGASRNSMCPPMTKEEIKQEAQTKYYRQALEVLDPPPDCLIMSFKVPMNEQKANLLFKQISSFLFKEDDVLVFENDNDLMPEEPQKEPIKNATPDKPKSAPLSERNSIRREGRWWKVYYKNKEAMLPDSAGMAYIILLLRHPGKAFTPNQLAIYVNSPLPDESEESEETITYSENSSPQGKLDYKARRLIKEKVLSLLETCRTAPVEEREDAEEEIEKIITQLRDMGHTLTIEGSEVFITHSRGKNIIRDADEEKSRKTISAAITRAIIKYTDAHEEFGKYLKKRIKMGRNFIYDDRDAAWEM